MTTLSIPAGAGGGLGSQNLRTGDAVAFPRFFDALAREVPFAAGLIITTLPRGTSQIVQPQRVSELLFKSYSRDFWREDKVTWMAMSQQRLVTLGDLPDAREVSEGRFGREFLAESGLSSLAAVYVKSPVFDGYPGVIWVGRNSEQGDFNAAEQATLRDAASELGEAIAGVRAARLTGVQRHDWEHALASRFFVFDETGRRFLPAEIPPAMEPHLYDGVARAARAALDERIAGKEVTDRVQIPDVDGELWTFHVVVHDQLEALGPGRFAVLALQPICTDWAAFVSADVQGDPELARLAPAIRFMQKEFRRSPTLADIAKTVHLSPFHFHRRFTDLVGLTPKHFLLECQIHESKAELSGKTKPLPQIATDCGFAHQSHFTSRFKQSTGLTPTRWRRLAARRQSER